MPRPTKLVASVAALLAPLWLLAVGVAQDVPSWPDATRSPRPWSYWWWMGSAVDKKNLTRELELHRAAGFGGMHIIPIYRAKGHEDQSIPYLSGKWLEMLDHVVSEAERQGLGIDMTLGTGWCFGGPEITNALANARVRHRMLRAKSGEPFDSSFRRQPTVLVGYGPNDRVVNLLDHLNGRRLRWDPPGQDEEWIVAAVWQQPSGRRVKRAAPGGEGWMLNPFGERPVLRFLARFDQALRDYRGKMPRAVYHDSYEYVCDWSPELLPEFEKRRGYSLTLHLRELFSDDDTEVVRRVKGDYRRTISDLMIERFNPKWTGWAKERGLLTRNEAHGSPGNLLDLYAGADIPETEFFRHDRNPLVAKFASSAAHVAGRRLVSSETATWLAEHFHVTLGHLKPFIDGLFVSGINHVFYHGTCYSPDSADWPGWVFYASTQVNSRNAIWHDLPKLNAYITRCQTVLQHGAPDSDIFLYWPIHDDWHSPRGLVRNMTVHNTAWLTKQPIGKTAAMLWRRGFAFDYVSDRQLAAMKPAKGKPRVIVVPPCRHMPIATYEALRRLARNGMRVVFEDETPRDVPGLHDLEARRVRRRDVLGKGEWFVVSSELGAALEKLGVRRERLVDHEGLRFIRRRDGKATWYFITNQDDQFRHNPATEPFDGWLPLSRPGDTVVVHDPLTGRAGVAKTRIRDGHTEARLQLAPGQSLFLRLEDRRAPTPTWFAFRPIGRPVPVRGKWQVRFLTGGPTLPVPFATEQLDSWTRLGDREAKRFAGTARYTITFDLDKPSATSWRLELGQVAESARVRLNGHELGTVFCEPFSVLLPNGMQLREKDNVLEIDVTNLSVNRLRDLDRRGVVWRRFHDINFVNIDYKEFDASKWPLRHSGLLGPVQLVPLEVAP